MTKFNTKALENAFLVLTKDNIITIYYSCKQLDIKGNFTGIAIQDYINYLGPNDRFLCIFKVDNKVNYHTHFGSIPAKNKAKEIFPKDLYLSMQDRIKKLVI